MKNKLSKKKRIIVITALVLVVAIGVGIWFGVGRGKAEPVNVYPFNYIGMTEYWGDSQESYGPVTTDKIQTVYLSSTQTVTEILVAPGDTVKKGDLLMTFDTTLSDLALERSRLNVEKLKLQLEDAKDRLKEINAMKPMVIPTVTQTEEEENQGTALTGSYRISTQSKYDGSTKELSLICWLASSTSIDNDLLEAIRLQAEDFQNRNAQKEQSSSSAPVPLDNEDPEPSESTPEPSESTPEPSESTPEPSESTPEPSESTPEPSESTPEPSESTPEPSESTPEPSESMPDASEDVPEESTDAEEDDYEPFEVYDYYVIFKVTSSNMSLGSTTVWQGMHIIGSAAGGFRFQFFDAYGMKDHTLAQEDASAVEQPEIDFGSGYTSAQIAELRSQQEKTIKDLQFQVKMAEADYKIMQTEMSDGNVYAEIDGEVVSVLTEEEAKLQQQPVLKVSGGGGFYVEGSVSELEKDNMQLGQEVTINDWNTGMTYTGTVESIGDFPSSNSYWSGVGNPNVSYYPFTVFIDGSADLQAGSYVSVMYSSATSEHGIYLRNPFVRTEKGESYIYVQGENGKLEKRIVTVGKSLWGSYTEILSGLTEEDLIAFPYGKNLKEGAATVESDLNALYE